ncbi:MAG: hypothetical protein RPS47_14390 [Colwellia sp.]|jgi:hypothetical protein
MNMGTMPSSLAIPHIIHSKTSGTTPFTSDLLMVISKVFDLYYSSIYHY